MYVCVIVCKCNVGTFLPFCLCLCVFVCVFVCVCVAQIITIRLTKPEIPDGIRGNYDIMEATRASLHLVTAQQHNELMREETTKRAAVLAATTAMEGVNTCVYTVVCVYIR